MSYFVVIRDAGPGWIDQKDAFAQPDVDKHAAFMNTLATEGIVLFAGPLAGSEHRRIRVLLIIDADSEADVQDHLSADPWAQTQRLVTTSIESWRPLVGVDRLSAVQVGSDGMLH